MGRIKRGLLLGMVLGMLLTGNENAYIDFYSTHYYNWQKTWFGTPLAGTPEQFGLKEAKPCMVGETHNDDASEIGMSLTEKYKTLHDQDWCGILVWMQTCDDPEVWYGYGFTKEATNAMAEYIPEKLLPGDE